MRIVLSAYTDYFIKGAAMDRQKLIELALETGLLQKVDGSYQISKYAYLSDIELFARAIAKQERKACVAEILEQIINEQIRETR